MDMAKMLKGIGQHIGVDKEIINVQDYKESFCQYMIFQPKNYGGSMNLHCSIVMKIESRHIYASKAPWMQATA